MDMNDTRNRVKQVIVIRKDLKMRRGKEIAQGSHASMHFITERVRKNAVTFTEQELAWFARGHAKITLQVETLAELEELHQKALDAGIESHIIEDEGVTEFRGVYTKTALAIGPDFARNIDPICSHLKLY